MTKLDCEVNAKIRSGDTDARNSMADARSQITSVMSVIRKATSAIVSAVSKAGKKSENGKIMVLQTKILHMSMRKLCNNKIKYYFLFVIEKKLLDTHTYNLYKYNIIDK